MQISSLLKKGSPLYTIAQSVAFMGRTRWRKVNPYAKKYPKVVQMPITYRCNSKCVMCNIWQMDHSNEMTLEEFGKFIKDPIFSRVEALGINGGEPSLIRELPAYTDTILSLPKLKSLNIITHGFNKKLLLPALEDMYARCKAKGVSFHVSISLDGYGEMHNVVRGLKVFNLTSQSIMEIKNNPGKYCDSMDLGCTVMLQNVDMLKELDAYAKMHDLDIKYRLGIENKRIESDKLKDQFSLKHHNVTQSAKEFFFGRYFGAKSLKEKFKYFSIFYHLDHKPAERLMGCLWQEDGITLDSRGELYYCAVASESIGSLREKGGEEIFFDDESLKHREHIIEHDCNNCIHDYHGRPPAYGVKTFLSNFLSDQFYWLRYYLKLRFL